MLAVNAVSCYQPGTKVLHNLNNRCLVVDTEVDSLRNDPSVKLQICHVFFNLRVNFTSLRSALQPSFVIIALRNLKLSTQRLL